MAHQLVNLLNFVIEEENQAPKGKYIVRVKALAADNGKDGQEATLYNVTLEIMELDKEGKRIDPKYLMKVYEMLVESEE